VTLNGKEKHRQHPGRPIVAASLFGRIHLASEKVSGVEETGQKACMVKSGTLRIWIRPPTTVPEDKEVEINRLQPGKIFGKLALFGSASRMSNHENKCQTVVAWNQYRTLQRKNIAQGSSKTTFHAAWLLLYIGSIQVMDLVMDFNPQCSPKVCMRGAQDRMVRKFLSFFFSRRYHPRENFPRISGYGTMTRLWNALLRILLVTISLFPVYVRYFWMLINIRLFRRQFSDEVWTRVHLKSAQRFYRLAARMRGGLIKIGQLISVRVDIVPREWTSTLAKLQDQVDPTPWPVVEKHLRSEFGKPPEEVFEKIETVAVKAASFGQVHKATTKEGKQVALKIRYPNIEMHLGIDLTIFRLALPLFNLFVPKLPLHSIYVEMNRALKTELNYEQEAEWTKQIHDNLAEVPHVYVPEVLTEYSTRSVICTTYFEGFKITDMAKIKELNVDLQELIRIVLSGYVKMVFVDGVFQSDPHPGNVLFRKTEEKPEVCILDFGQVKVLPKDFQRKLIQSALAFMSKDVDGFKNSLVSLGLFTERDAELTRPVIVELFDKYAHLTPTEVKALDFSKIRDDAQAFIAKMDGIVIPNDIVLYGRTFGLLSGLVTQLDPNINGFEVARPMMMQALMRPENLMPLPAPQQSE
jgi:ubiquinone biosynthesis protein